MLLECTLSLNNKEKDILKCHEHYSPPKNVLLTQIVKLIMLIVMKKRTKWSETSGPYPIFYVFTM